MKDIGKLWERLAVQALRRQEEISKLDKRINKVQLALTMFAILYGVLIVSMSFILFNLIK